MTDMEERDSFILSPAQHETVYNIWTFSEYFNRFFKGATEHYLNSNKSHLRQTSAKLVPNQLTIDKIQQSNVWKMENELYEFALEHFKFVKKRLLLKEPNSVAQIYFYEKIRPK
jgi:heparan sulfate 2-O-sulfotransferase HS2ST1